MSVIEQPLVVSPETPIHDPVGELLEKAAERIERVGWRRGHSFGGKEMNDARCAAVTIAYAQDPISIPVREAALKRLSDYLVQHYGVVQRYGTSSLGTIFSWNDKSDRTAQEVCRALREAAAAV